MSRKCHNDLTGQTFDQWKVLKPAQPDEIGRARWYCCCSCGERRIVYAHNLLSGKSTSCGHTRVSKMRNKMADIKSKWYRVSDGKNTLEVKNLSKFVRDHADRFNCNPEDKSQWLRVVCGLYSAARLHCRYYGWTVERIDKEGTP